MGLWSEQASQSVHPQQILGKVRDSIEIDDYILRSDVVMFIIPKSLFEECHVYKLLKDVFEINSSFSIKS